MPPDRWDRLTRYARWRQWKFPLLQLPGDVLAHMCRTFLEYADVCHLMEALHGPLDHHARACVVKVPRDVQALWVLSAVQCTVRRFLQHISDECFFLAAHCSMVRVFVDWTPFCGRKGTPVAEYKWNALSPHANMHTDGMEILRVIQQSHIYRRPMGQVSMYQCFLWSYGRIHMNHRPSRMCCVPLVPCFHL